MPERLQTWLAIPWFQFAAFIVLAIVVGLIAYAIARGIVRRVLDEETSARKILKRINGPLLLLFPLLACTVVIERAAIDTAWFSTVQRLASLLLIGVLTWLAVRLIAGVEAIIASHNALQSGNGDNLRARSILTQTRVLGRTAMVIAILIGIAAMLMTFPGARQIGASLLASAGLAGLVAGFAARQVLGNLLAGVQIAIAQPIRLDDVLVVEGEWGRVEEITGTYVVIRIWDERRLVVPLEYFISKPFQNWTRQTSQLIGSVFVWVDYALPLDPIRAELERLCKAAKEWDGRVCVLQVTDADERAVQLRALVSSADSSQNWDLRCNIREGLITYIAREHPEALPRLRADGPPDATATAANAAGAGSN